MYDTGYSMLLVAILAAAALWPFSSQHPLTVTLIDYWFSMALLVGWIGGVLMTIDILRRVWGI